MNQVFIDAPLSDSLPVTGMYSQSPAGKARQIISLRIFAFGNPNQPVCRVLTNKVPALSR